MKYELEPDNRNCADDELIADLKRIAVLLSKKTVTKDEYNKHGRFSAATLQNRFGSWNSAIEKAGLDFAGRMSIPHEELIADMRAVAVKVGSTTLTRESYRDFGKFSDGTIVRAFGTWAGGLDAASLHVSSSYYTRASDDELFGNLAKVWKALGRQPRKAEMRRPLSEFSGNSYARRFGSWRKALVEFVSAASTTIEPEPNTSSDSSAKTDEAPTLSTPKRTTREPSWRLRFIVHRRDRFACIACGRSPATHPGTVLHLDHVVPWSKGGETTFDNMQTLCEECNLGKGDLNMETREG